VPRTLYDVWHIVSAPTLQSFGHYLKTVLLQQFFCLWRCNGPCSDFGYFGHSKKSLIDGWSVGRSVGRLIIAPLESVVTRHCQTIFHTSISNNNVLFCLVCFTTPRTCIALDQCILWNITSYTMIQFCQLYSHFISSDLCSLYYKCR